MVAGRARGVRSRQVESGDNRRGRPGLRGSRAGRLRLSELNTDTQSLRGDRDIALAIIPSVALGTHTRHLYNVKRNTVLRYYMEHAALYNLLANIILVQCTSHPPDHIHTAEFT